MRKIYLNILIGIIILLWIVFFIQQFNKNKQTETFIPHMRGIYRPYIRMWNQHYESFINKCGPQVIWTKLRKWNIF